jgi:hypothetical protein
MVDINLTPGALVYSAAAAISSKEEHRSAEASDLIAFIGVYQAIY